MGVVLDGVTTKDVRDGNLKASLGLFFALSKHKQQQKQQAERDKQRQPSSEDIVSRYSISVYCMYSIAYSCSS